MSRRMRANLLLLLTAFIWGSAFVAQQKGMDFLGPFSFNGVRNIVAAIALIPVIYFLDKSKAKAANATSETHQKLDKRILLLGGLSCGVILFVSSSLQQIGLQYTTAGKAGFITSLYIVIVPILGLLLKHKVKPIIWLCVALGAVGLYLLSITNGLNIERGDLLVFLCAFGFSTHILVIDHFSPQTDGVRMSCIQFFIVGVISLIVAFAMEADTFTFSNTIKSIIPILYTGVLSSGVGYTLQIVAQKDAIPSVASLLMSFESVFALLSGMFLLDETLTTRQFIGCALMFAAIMLAQIPSKEERLAARSIEKSQATNPEIDFHDNNKL